MVARSIESALPARTARMWLQPIRPSSLTASVVPVLLGTALAAAQGLVNPGLILLTLLGAVTIQGAAILFSDYFVPRGSADISSYEGSGMFVRDSLRPSGLFLAALMLVEVAAAIVLYFAAIRGAPILVLGTLAVLGGALAYKYRALEGPMIFLLFGPLTVLGAYYVQAASIEMVPVLYALPIGCLVTAILRVHTIRDAPVDDQAGGTTVARGLGATFLLYGPLVAAYLLVVAGVAAGTFVRWSALALLSAPLAWTLARRVATAKASQDLAMVDVAAARVHLAFGLLLVAGVLLPIS
jgi:1,4-dihydroxy-2-naphthoate polyprenyltransferase